MYRELKESVKLGWERNTQQLFERTPYSEETWQIALTKAEDISILRHDFEKGSGRILEYYIYYLKVQKVPGKSEIPLATPFFCESCFSPQQKPCDSLCTSDLDETLTYLHFILSLA